MGALLLYSRPMDILKQTNPTIITKGVNYKTGRWGSLILNLLLDHFSGSLFESPKSGVNKLGAGD